MLRATGLVIVEVLLVACLVTVENTQQVPENTNTQVASVNICGRSQKFSIQRSRINADSILIAAKKI
jgi:hypothetical protein